MTMQDQNRNAKEACTLFHRYQEIRDLAPVETRCFVFFLLDSILEWIAEEEGNLRTFLDACPDCPLLFMEMERGEIMRIAPQAILRPTFTD